MTPRGRIAVVLVSALSALLLGGCASTSDAGLASTSLHPKWSDASEGMQKQLQEIQRYEKRVGDQY